MRRRMMTEPRDSLWRMILPPTIWALHFVIVYGLTAVLCAKAGAAETARTGVLAASTVALALIGLSGWRAWRQWDYRDTRHRVHDGQSDADRREFLGHVAFLLALISAIGVVFVTLPVIWIGSCR